jgi:SSS family solute:Na+ symporter
MIFTKLIFDPTNRMTEYLKVGKLCTMGSVLFAILGSFIAMRFDNVMNYIQLLFSFFNAPLIGIFLLGMFWERASAVSGFWGLLMGTLAGIGHFLCVESGILVYKTDMVSNFYGAIYSGFTCIFVIWFVSMFTKKRPIEELQGLLYSTRDQSIPFWDRKLLLWGSALILVLIAFNLWLA